MPDPHREKQKPTGESARAKDKTARQDEPMDDEEKVLAGRLDANMPALLTKDVKGG